MNPTSTSTTTTSSSLYKRSSSSSNNNLIDSTSNTNTNTSTDANTETTTNNNIDTNQFLHFNGSPSNIVNNTNNNNNNSTKTTITDGWLELFLSSNDKYNFSLWKNEIHNYYDSNTNISIIQLLVNTIEPYIKIQAIIKQYIPNTISPNSISLSGLLLLIQCWYITYTYNIYLSTISCTILAVCNIILFYCTCHITIYHSINSKQQTSLNDLFKYTIDNNSTIFFTLIIIYCLLPPNNNNSSNNIIIQWYCVQCTQLILLIKHISAYNRCDSIRYRYGTGPDEVLLFSIFLLLVKVIVGYEYMFQILTIVFNKTIVVLSSNTSSRSPYISTMLIHLSSSMSDSTTTSNINIGEEIIKLMYYTCFILTIIQALSLSRSKHGWTQFALIVSLIMRLVPAILLKCITSSTSTTTNVLPITITDVICDGMFVAVITCDIIVAKMSRRQLHPWIVLMSIASVLSYPVIIILLTIYYIGIFSDLCYYLNMPLLTTCINVYCDGIYDLCHIGHKKSFHNALQYGNRLYVGVVNDIDASYYKRIPIMTSIERCAEVTACKAVTKVIENAPCFGITIDFINYHQIHIVAMGEEYISKYPNPYNDPYYKIPRLLGIARTLPRTNTLSTTELIERIITKQNSLQTRNDDLTYTNNNTTTTTTKTSTNPTTTTTTSTSTNDDSTK